MISNGYSDTYVGYHAEYRPWGAEWRRGAFAQISETYSAPYRIYGHSYADLYDNLITAGFKPLNGVCRLIQVLDWNFRKSDIDRACEALGDIPHFVADRTVFDIGVGAADLREAVRRLNAAGFETDQDEE